MTGQKKLKRVIEALKCITSSWNDGMKDDCASCLYSGGGDCLVPALKDALALLEANKEEIMALRRLVEWAEECGFGLDNIYWEEYVKPEELEGMAYIEQLIYIAKKAVKKDE